MLVGKGKYDVGKELGEWFRGAGRVVVVGVGNPIRMDDFVGVAIVRGLRGKVDESRVMLIEAETVPENYMQEIIDYKSTHVLLIDAAVLGMKGGEAKLINPDELTMVSAFSTHVLPLRIFCEHLAQETGTKIALLLIEPKLTDFGEGLSSEVNGSSKSITSILSWLLSR